jgi:hypothetical protein
MSDQSAIDNEIEIDTVSSRRLYGLGCTGVILASVFLAWRSPLEDPVLLLIGVVILVLGCLPGLLWARHSRPWFPCFEISMLTGVIFYAMPLLTLADGLKTYPNSVLQTSGLLVIAYMATAITAYGAVRNPRKAPYWAVGKLLPDSIHRYLPAGLLINTLYICLDRFTKLIPFEFLGSIRALCFGLGIITAFIYSCAWGRRALRRRQKIFFSVCLGLQIIVLFSHLYLINGISLLILSAIGYTTTRRSLPWLPIVILLPVIAILHNGKSQMRAIYWAKTVSMPALGQLPSFFGEWVSAGLEKNTEEEDSKNVALKLADRASLLQMIAMSVDQVPSLRPHLGGESYVDIPAQVVPRFLWPDKPSSLMSNVRLALYFNLVDPNDPFTTSIAFGIISESYVNFGFFGVLLIGTLTGLGFKHITLRSVGAPMFSAIGIFMVLLTAWCFQVEQVLATWLASLFQASAISIIVPLAWKKFFGTL